MMNHILIVCVGNICRSPVAEALLQNRLVNVIPSVVVSSAGLNALVGYPADPMSQTLALECGLDLSAHRARLFTIEMAREADLILVMTTDQQRYIEKNVPSLCGRIHRLGKWGGFDVPDPFQRHRFIFEQSMHLMKQGVDEWYSALWN